MANRNKFLWFRTSKGGELGVHPDNITTFTPTKRENTVVLVLRNGHKYDLNYKKSKDSLYKWLYSHAYAGG